MKKTFIILSVIALSVFCFSSCSNEDNLQEIAEVSSYDPMGNITFTPVDTTEILNIKSEIAEYNLVNFSPEHSKIQKGKGWWRKFWQGVATVLSDAVGGFFGSLAGTSIGPSGSVVGAAVGATCVSGLVGYYIFKNDVEVTPFVRCQVRSKDTVYKNIVPSYDGSKISTAFKEWENDSIGYYHNDILYNIFSDSTMLKTMWSMTDSELFKVFTNQLYSNSPVYSAKYNRINEQSYIELAQTIWNSLDNSTSFEDFCTKLNETAPIDKSVLLLLEEYMRGLSQTDPENENGNYFRDMMNIVDNSKLRKEEKQALQKSFIVGQASYHLWNDNASTLIK